MMEHYVELIELFGSADGFNTESPERLHIDYAKDAYRASNKKDYVHQMTTWLRRQESIARFSVYLEWCKGHSIVDGAGGSKGPSPPHEMPGLPQHVEDTAEAVIVESQTAASGQTTTTFKVAKRHPAALRNIPASEIILENHATQFLPALTTFLRNSCNTQFVPQSFDMFDLFKRITFQLPSIAEVSDRKLTNIVRASPPIPASGRRPAEPAHLDFALLRTGESNAVTDGTSLQGE